MTRHVWDPICLPPDGLVRPVRIDPAGVDGPTRGQAHGPRWRRTSYGFFVPVDVPDVPEQRILEQSIRLPAGGAVTGWASCRMLRASFFDGLEADGRTLIPVPLAVGVLGNPRPDRAVTILRERLESEEVVVLHGVPCTRDRRALFDEMRRVVDVREAVVAMDMMAAAERVSIARMRAYAEAHARWRRVRQVRAALDLADERSRSPNETRMRLIWQIDAGFVRPLVNQPVWDRAGNLLGIADLLDPVAGVVGEFDGADHRSALRHSKDVDREARFRGHQLELFRVTGPDIPQRSRVVQRMASARSRAKWLPEADRPWTIVPPSGWPIDPTLDEALDDRDARWALYAQWEQDGTAVADRVRS